MPKFNWKKKKTIAMLLNKRQWLRDFDPSESAGYEIEIEQGGSYIITQSSNPSTPTYIIKE